MSLDEARSQLSTFETACAGSTGPEIAEALHPLLDLFITSVPDTWERASAALYVELLSDVPPDLLCKGVRRTMLTCNLFPTVAQIREQIAEELSDRRYTKLRLASAVRFTERDQQIAMERRNRRAAERAA